jgi:dTDP-4-dehydrorhamnose reductase
VSERVLLLGASGLLGSHLAVCLPDSFATFAPRPRGRTRTMTGSRVSWLPFSVEATDDDTVARAIAESAATVVVNAVGVTPGSPLAGDRRIQETINGRFPHRLASHAARAGARVVHISTDAVFSGMRGAYREDDTPDPVDDYGRTKLAGELAAPHLTIRTSFFGRTPRGTGLVEWAIAQHGRTIDGFVDYRFSGLAAAVLSDLIATAIDVPALEGVYHVGGDPMSKYDLLTAIVDRLHIDLRVVPVRRGGVDRTLVSDRFFSAVGRARPSVQDSLTALVSCGVFSRN